MYGRKCSLVTRKELGYSALKPEKLEVITAFVASWKRSICDGLSRLGSGKASAPAACLPIVFDFTAGQTPCYIL